MLHTWDICCLLDVVIKSVLVKSCGLMGSGCGIVSVCVLVLISAIHARWIGGGVRACEFSEYFESPFGLWCECSW